MTETIIVVWRLTGFEQTAVRLVSCLPQAPSTRIGTYVVNTHNAQYEMMAQAFAGDAARLTGSHLGNDDE